MSGPHNSPGKGSKRRPLGRVTEDEFAQNWARIFGHTGPAAKSGADLPEPPVGEVLVKNYTAKSDWVIPTLEEIMGEKPRQ